MSILYHKRWSIHVPPKKVIADYYNTSVNCTFSGQIFFDFAGYSTCAIGIALCLGFVLPENFRYPYAAIGFSDFWRRWHITLSSWLRDYLYIPIGGNRKGEVRTYVNLMITMLLGGLWHGAPTIDMIKVTTVVTLMVIFHWFMRDTSVMQVAQKMKWWMVSIVWSFMLIALIISQKSSDSFVYFQFWEARASKSIGITEMAVPGHTFALKKNIVISFYFFDNRWHLYASGEFCQRLDFEFEAALE